MSRTAGVVGLGAMGLQMARHMIAKGFDVSGTDLSQAAVDRAAAAGVRIVPSVLDLAAAEMILVMVATDAQVEEVIFRAGLLDRIGPETVICISSSTSVRTAKHLAERAAEKGRHILDTPVMLGQEAADNGTLTVFCGGEAAAFDHARPFLQAFGANVLHVGPAGMGQLGKSVNNLLLWACLSANYEALKFAKEMGADIPQLLAALQFSSGANWSLSRWGKSSGKWAEKDMDVALDMAQEAKVPMPLAALVDQLMKGMDREKMRALLK